MAAVVNILYTYEIVSTNVPNTSFSIQKTENQIYVDIKSIVTLTSAFTFEYTANLFMPRSSHTTA